MDRTADAATTGIAALREGDVVRVTVSGELDLQVEPQVVEVVAGALEAGGARRLVLDVTGVEFIDSSGLRALLTASGLARRAGLEPTLAVRPGPVTRLLDVAGIGGWFAYE